MRHFVTLCWLRLLLKLMFRYKMPVERFEASGQLAVELVDGQWTRGLETLHGHLIDRVRSL